MKHAIEIAHLVGGEVVSVRRLSARRDRIGTASALLAVAALSLTAMTVGAAAVRGFGRAIYAPWFVVVWGGMALAVSALAVHLVRRRLRRYVLGSRLEADAFASVDIDLVRRWGDRFDLTIVPGMQGHVESGRAPLPVEALVTDRPRTISLAEGATAQLSLGSSTFIVRSRPVEAPRADERPAGPRAFLSSDLFKLFSRTAMVGIQVAFIGTLFCAVPSGQTIGDRASHLIAPRITTPWEAEKWLRIEAQLQARSLHQCFDPLPMACQQPGYVGVGVSLARDGEVRSNWIARSTYSGQCAVDQCIKNVVSTWVFDPLPEPMRVVLPVQVLRTDKPLPPKVAEARGAMTGADMSDSATVPWLRGR